MHRKLEEQIQSGKHLDHINHMMDVMISKKDDFFEVLDPKGISFLSDIENRLKQSENEKVIDRVNVLLEGTIRKNPEMAESYIEEMRNDLLNLIDGETDNSLLERYPNWEREDFKELYKILFGEYVE